MTMRHFTVTTEGQDRLGLRAPCEAYCNEQWLAAHMADTAAAESLFNQFKRAVAGELELQVVECPCDAESDVGTGLFMPDLGNIDAQHRSGFRQRLAQRLGFQIAKLDTADDRHGNEPAHLAVVKYVPL